MKIRFKYPHTDDSGTIIYTLLMKTNEKFVFEYKNKDFVWMLVNSAKIKSILLLGSYKGGKKHWCNSLAYKNIYKALPLLKSNDARFNLKGFPKRILKALFDKMEIKASIEDMTKESWEQYLETTFKE